MSTDKNGKYTAGYLHYERRSPLDDIPDNYAERIMANIGKSSGKKKEKKSCMVPQGFTVAPAYNKGGYQVIPKEDV
jgi:hypothetical protein